MAGTRLLAGHRPVRRDVTIGELAAVVRDIIAAQLRVVEDAFARNRVTMLRGRAQFVDPHTIVIDGEDGARTVTVDRIVIAVGTRPALPPHVPFNDRTIFTTDTLRYLTQLPQSFLVVGGGVIGTELACTLSALGVQVTLVEGRAELLGFVDREIIEAFQTSIRRQGITLRLVG